MKLNKGHWDLWKQSEKGQASIELFEAGEVDKFLEKYLGEFHLDVPVTTDYIDELLELTTSPIIPEELSEEQAEALFDLIASEGIKMTDEDGEFKITDVEELLSLIPVISTWLYLRYPDFYKPYFFRNRFRLLTRIADAFDIILPTVPLKRYKKERLKYYWQLCQAFLDFQEENELTAAEFCAFLYDFAPKDLAQNDEKKHKELPLPSQVWMVGGDKGGTDFEFLDNFAESDTHFWQGNVDTKKGDILVMYCLAPRSYIHSIWRATTDGIADPFFHWYGSIYIGEGQKITPITLDELKSDSYFSQHPLVRKNLQGVNGYSLTSQDYSRLLQVITEKRGTIADLPQLDHHTINSNQDLNNEREVEIALIEPLLIKIGYSSADWVRQLTVKMGTVERNRPDYTFLTNSKRGEETASMLIESKFHIKNKREMEDTFEQVRSYGLRLSAKTLVIADKDSIWIYQRENDRFDRTNYIKKFWTELEDPDHFNSIKKLIGK